MIEKKIIWGIVTLLVVFKVCADTCPSLENSSLAWGEIPPPWVVSPGSRDPQPEEGASFREANILIAGYTVGVACTYGYSQGTYSIFYQTRVSRPSRDDMYWYEKPGGYGCSMGINDCEFYPQRRAVKP